LKENMNAESIEDVFIQLARSAERGVG